MCQRQSRSRLARCPQWTTSKRSASDYRICLIAIARLRSCGPRAALLLIVRSGRVHLGCGYTRIKAKAGAGGNEAGDVDGTTPGEWPCWLNATGRYLKRFSEPGALTAALN
jgi:hypothetical protein